MSCSAGAPSAMYLCTFFPELARSTANPPCLGAGVVGDLAEVSMRAASPTPRRPSRGSSSGGSAGKPPFKPLPCYSKKRMLPVVLGAEPMKNPASTDHRLLAQHDSSDYFHCSAHLA